MHNRIKNLEELVSQACALVRRLEGENHSLKKQVENLTGETQRLRSDTKKLRELSDWRDRARTRLQKLCNKLDKVIR